MKKMIWIAALLFSGAETAWASPGSASNAPTLPTDPVLSALIEQSLARRPELAQARATAQAERERVPQAGALPDPMLQLGVQNDGFSAWQIGKMETSYYSIMASQTFVWPGKLSLKSDVAELGAGEADQNAARVALSTEAEVRRAYLDLVLARDRLALLDRLEAIWKKSAMIATTRYETGQGAQSDVLRSQLELNRIRQRRWSLRVDEGTQTEALNRLRAHPLDELIATSTRLVDLALPAQADNEFALSAALERSPELVASLLATRQAQRAVALAGKGYIPDFSVGVGVMPRGGDFPPMWLASIGATLPVFAGVKQSRAVSESEARAVAALRRAEELEQVLRLRVAQRHTAMAATIETIHLYTDGLLVQSEATTDSTLRQYEVGKVTFASVLEANAGFIADQDAYLQALSLAHRLAIDAAEVSLAPISSASTGMGTAAVPGAAGPAAMNPSQSEGSSTSSM
jgi:cobalt-zinc-cadmium efflux system outer membrane protein